jgi:hypothetical protein
MRAKIAHFRGLLAQARQHYREASEAPLDPECVELAAAFLPSLDRTIGEANARMSDILGACECGKLDEEQAIAALEERIGERFLQWLERHVLPWIQRHAREEEGYWGWALLAIEGARAGCGGGHRRRAACWCDRVDSTWTQRRSLRKATVVDNGTRPLRVAL